MFSIRLALLLVIWITSIHTFAQTGPGGVGDTSGTGSLSLWLDANQGISEISNDLTQWDDQSGYANHATPPTTTNRPTYNATGTNGYPIITFDGTNHYLTAVDAASLDLTTWSIIVVGIINTHKNYNAFVVKGSDAQENYEFLTNFPGTGNIHYPVRYTTGGRSTDSEAGEVFSTTSYGVYQLDYDQTNFEFYIDGNLTETDAETRTPLTNGNPLYIANELGTSGRTLNGSLAELMIFSSPVNDAQRLILHNAMAAKYGFTLSANDFYNEDNAGAGNYDHDVAGIGRVNAANIHNDAQGTGIVRILNPTGLGNNEYMMWGHDNGNLVANNTTDVPAGIDARFERVWRVSEVNAAGNGRNVGAVDVRWDLTGLGAVTASDLRMLIDTDNDGVFSDQTPISGATDLGGNVYEFAGVPGNASGFRNNRRFTLATVNTTTTPLPIELLSFDVQLRGETVAINWSTASETNNDFFTIQRSADGVEFADILTIPGAGNSDQVLSYDTLDTQPLAGRSFYRLKQTDFDGTFSFSSIESVFRNVQVEKFSVFPNPASEYIEIKSDSKQAGFTVLTFTNTQGKVVLRQVLKFNAGAQMHRVYLPNLSNGVFFANFKGRTNTYIPVIIKR